MPMAKEHRELVSQHDVGDIKPKDKSLLDFAMERISTKNSKDLIYVRTSAPSTSTASEPGDNPLPPPAPDPLPPNPVDHFKPDEPNMFEKPTFLPPKPVPHSPKISPSSIPNPSPSVISNKPLETGYPNYGGYLYSIPGYSAFQPVSYPGMLPPQPPISQADTSSSDFMSFSSIPKDNTEEKTSETKVIENQTPIGDQQKPQTDFEDQFTPEIVPAITSEQNTNNIITESKMSITSLAQGSGATVTIPSPMNKDVNRKKQQERYSLKTSIPISKIDMKCVNNPPETPLSSAKKPSTTFNPAFQNTKNDVGKVEIQSNIIIKSALKESEVTDKQITANNMNTLINAAEAVNKSDMQFRKPDPKTDVINEIKDPPSTFTPTTTNATRPVFNPINVDSSKVNYPPKPPEGNFNEQKNQILFIQNKNQNPKMLLTIQQQNPQVLLQRTNFESKNAQVPSRLSSQSKKCKEDAIENGNSSKVVALKRLHQENCDENDFENLITENQIYGNKIVVKEKSQGTLQEQDLKNKKTNDKLTQETKNVVLQPNFLYLSNLQFPANLMMIKNNAKVNQNAEQKMNKVATNENKSTTEAGTMTNSNEINASKNSKPQNTSTNKEIHVIKSNNNVMQTLSNKNNKTDLVFQTPHQKVIMNSQIVYQVPMLVDADNKLNQPFANREYSKYVGQNKTEYSKQFDSKSNDKLYIACPYQMDSKLQPKIVITNIRPKITKIDEFSSLDLYEKRKRMRRLKYLTNRDTKETTQKSDLKKEKTDVQRNIITPDKIKEEICKELTSTKIQIDEASSESESDYGEDDLDEYETIIKGFGDSKENDSGKSEFLANFRLGTHAVYKDKELDRQERILSRDSVASACIAVGRLDRLTNEVTPEDPSEMKEIETATADERDETENGVTLQRKQTFLTQLKLTQVTPQCKEGFEKIWQEIMKERKRRDGVPEVKQIPQPKLTNERLQLDTNGQLQILTEIKKSVNENNNLIKRKLDSLDSENVTDGDSIHILAEKNFSELNRLSKMADRSVKLMTGQDTKKRDLNPGFDSENIQKPALKYEQPFQNYPQINIPNISKIISLKSQDDAAPKVMTTQVTSQATSMDEPMNSAAGVEEFVENAKVKDFACQVDEVLPWPGLEAVKRSYREFETARKKEINELHRRNTALRVEGAHITRIASRDSDGARALLAERQHLATEENNVRISLQKLITAIEVLRNYRTAQ